MDKYSNFHATVNFNKDDANLIYRMRQAVEALVQPEYLWQWLKHYANGAQEDFDEDERENVYGVRLRAAFEHEGKTNRGLHVHLLIEVCHSTAVQISKRGFSDVFGEVVGLTPNCNIRFVKGTGEDKDFILHYLTKEVPGYKPQGALNARLKSAFSGKNEEQEAEADL